MCLSVSRTPFICPLALPVGFLPGLGASLSSSGLGIPARRTSVVQLSSQSPEPESPPSAASPVFTLNDWDVGKGHLSWVTHSVGMAQTSSPTDPRLRAGAGVIPKGKPSLGPALKERVFSGGHPMDQGPGFMSCVFPCAQLPLPQGCLPVVTMFSCISPSLIE